MHGLYLTPGGWVTRTAMAPNKAIPVAQFHTVRELRDAWLEWSDWDAGATGETFSVDAGTRTTLVAIYGEL